MNYQEWLTQWLEHYIQPTAKDKTCNRYAEIVRQHIVPALGAYELHDLTALLLQSYVTKLLKTGNLKTGGGLAANSVNAVINVIQSSLKTAFCLGYVDAYTADKIKRPKITGKQVDCFSKSEQKVIERGVLNGKKPQWIGIVLCLYTGLRIGELLALEWSDIDFKKGILSVTKSCHDGKDSNGRFARITEAPKTESSVRAIPLPRQMAAILRDMKKKSRSTFVVSNGEKPISVRSYQRSFSTLLCKWEIPHKGFHALRHTFATRALECGMDVKTLSEILGHKSPTVTLNRYVHSFLEHKRDMMNRMGRLITWDKEEHASFRV